MTKDELLEKLRTGQRDWEAFLSRIPAAQREQPNASGTWSIKDVLAHSGVWERFVTARLRAHERGGAAAPGELWGEFVPHGLADDALNQWCVDQIKHRSFDELLGLQREVRMQLIGTVQALSEHTLSAPEVRVAGLDWKGDTPLWQVIASMSIDHIATHMAGLTVD